MTALPVAINILFGITALITVWLFFLATNRSRYFLLLIIAWMLFQSVSSLQGFYKVTDSVPPRFFLLIGPPLFVIIILLLTKKGKVFLDGLNLKMLTILHIIRIPVEVVLYFLFVHKLVPELMTFEGRNFDILSGISAPIIVWLAFAGQKLKRPTLLLIWNFICLGLLLNIVINAVLSAPFPFQQFGFDQPNIALLQFPFTLLPGCVVPLVLLTHIASIRKLLLTRQNEVFP